MKQILLTLCGMFVCLSHFAQQNYSRVKIYTDSKGLQQLSELGVTIDHGVSKKDIFFISDFSESEITRMKDNGFQYEILIQDVKQYYKDQNLKPAQPIEKNATCSASGNGGGSTFTPNVPSNFTHGSMGGYYTYQEFLDQLDSMVAKYPALISPRATISNYQTFQGRPIYWMRISDNANTDETNETEVLYSGVHHAREPISMSELVFYMWYLLEHYATSEEIQFLVNNTELYFVPCVNPDGYIYNHTTDPTGGGMHRKNCRNVGTTNIGVDINRNYSYGWGTTGVSFNLDDDTYPGTGAFSEPETQAMKWFCEQRDFMFAFNAHSYANDILYPIGTTTTEFAVDNDYLAAFTSNMVQYNGFANMKSSDMYPASGDSDDFMYKEDTINKPKIFAMTPEIGSDAQGFWPAESDINSLCQDMVYPDLMLAHLTHKYLDVKDLDPSQIETMTGDFNHSAYRLGQESGPVTVSIEPLIGIQSVGTPSIHDIAIMQTENGAISYVLNPSIQFGDPIKYVLNTDYGLWIDRDTITKTFGSITLQLLDNATTNSGWTGSWGLSSTQYYSPSNSFTDSPNGNYSMYANTLTSLIQPINLTNATSAMISFYAKWDIESSYDFCQFQVSVDGGSNWIPQCGHYTVAGSGPAAGGVQPLNQPLYEGTQSTWVREEINLSDYLGHTIKVRFNLQSDGGLQKDGFYYDDFQVMYNQPNGAGLDELTLEMKTMPNPASTFAYVSLSKVLNKGSVKLYDQTGKLVQNQDIQQPTNKVTIDVEKLPVGIYTVHLTGTNMVVKPVKLVVVH